MTSIRMYIVQNKNTMKVQTQLGMFYSVESLSPQDLPFLYKTDAQAKQAIINLVAAHPEINMDINEYVSTPCYITIPEKSNLAIETDQKMVYVKLPSTGKIVQASLIELYADGTGLVSFAGTKPFVTNVITVEEIHEAEKEGN